jgi:hypothetical protein
MPIAIGAIVCGVLGLERVKAQPETWTGKGPCIAGIVLGALGLLLGVATLLFSFAPFLFDALKKP